MEKSLSIRGLDFSYNSHLLFSNFSLQSHSRRLVLKGPSGCGKTTLLRILFGALKPQNCVEFPCLEQSVLVLQEDALFPWLTGRENIVSFLSIDKTKLESSPLYNVVSNFIDKKACQMSYGQRRSIELFRATLHPAPVFLLDEPFNYLDDNKAAAFISYLATSVPKNTLSVITTHRHDSSLDGVSDVFIFKGDPPFSRLERL